MRRRKVFQQRHPFLDILAGDTEAIPISSPLATKPKTSTPQPATLQGWEENHPPELILLYFQHDAKSLHLALILMLPLSHPTPYQSAHGTVV